MHGLSPLNIGETFPAVLAAAQTGDSDAITILYRSLNPLLLRYYRTNAPAVAEDLAQEVWLSAGPRLGSFQGDEAQFRTWMFTVARRRLIDHWRAKGRRVDEVHAELDQPAMDHDPAAQLVSDEAIAELTAGLTEEQREVVTLRIVGDLSADDVAAILDKSPRAVRVMQHRAIRKVAARLNQNAVTK